MDKRILNRPGSWHLYGIVISLPRDGRGGRKGEKERRIDSPRRKRLAPHWWGKSRESKCPQHGILRDCNARGRNLTGKGGAGHFQEGAGS